MIGRLLPVTADHIRTAIAWPRTGDELRAALGDGFALLDPPPVPGALSFVHRRTCALVEAAVQDGVISGQVILVVEEDARLYLADLLARYESMEPLLELLDELQGLPPIVLEIFARGRRLVLPMLPCVIEVRGRRKVEAVRILDVARSSAALDATLRLIQDRAALQRLFPLARRVGDTGQLWTLLNGTVGAEQVEAGGGFRLLDADALAAAVAGRLEAAGSIDAADALMALAFERFGRAETADRRGDPQVTWRLDGAQRDLVRTVGDARTARCVVKTTTRQ